MTQKSAVKHSSPFKVRFSERIRSEKILFSALLIINLLGLPVLIWGIMNKGTQPVSDTEIILTTVMLAAAGLMTAASITAGVICGVKKFHYLLNRQKADMVLSLPADRKSLFMADWLAGLVLCTGPALISAIITVVIIIADGSAPRTYIFDTSRPDLEALFIILSFLTAVILCYSYSVLCTVHSSSVASAVLNNIIVNILVFGAVYSAGGCIVMNSFGFTGIESYQITAFFSPVGILRGGIYYSLMLHPFITVLVNLTAAAAAAFFSFRVFLKKTPEKITEKMTAPGVYCITVFSAAVCLIMYMTTRDIYPLPVVIVIAAAAFIISEFIRKKKAGKKSFSIIYPAAGFAAAAVFSLSLPAVIRSTDCFGLVNWTPEASETIMTEYYGDIPGMTSALSGYIDLDNREDAETAELVKKLQHSIIETCKETFSKETLLKDYKNTVLEEYYNTVGAWPKDYNITYWLKDGRRIERAYTDLTRSEQTRKTAAEIGASEQVKNIVFNHIQRNFKSWRTLFTDCSNSDTYRNSCPVYSVNFDTDLSPEQSEEFYSILHDDIFSATAEILMNYDDTNPEIINVNNSYWLPPYFEKTIDYLQKNFFTDKYLVTDDTEQVW